MKRSFTFVLLSLCAMLPLSAQSAGTIELKHNGYRLTASVGAKEVAGIPLVPMYAGVLDTLTKKKTPVVFGFLFREPAKNLSKVIAAEVFDASTNRSLRKITLEEWLGTSSAVWNVVNRGNNATAYSFTVAGRSFTIVRSVNAVINQNVITGKMISETVSMESNQTGRVRLKLYGKAEGAVTGTGTLIKMTANDPNSFFAPTIILSYGDNASVEVAKNAKKVEPVTFSVTSADIAVTAGRSEEVLTVAAFGTSISYNNHSQKQANNLQQYLGTKRTVPELAAVTSTDRASVMPGDTMTYTIVYHNIGTAAAADVTISNPIPAGTVYVDNSATGEGGTVTVERQPASLPKIGAVTSVSWNFKDPIYPGEERSAKFKVILQ